MRLARSVLLLFTLSNLSSFNPLLAKSADGPCQTALSAPDAAINTPSVNNAEQDAKLLKVDTAEPTKSKDEQTSKPAASSGSEKPTSPSISGTKVDLSNGVPAICWIDKQQQSKAALLCIHGLSLHKGNYDSFGQRMAKDGYAVFAIDVRGFGDWMKKDPSARIDLQQSLADIGQVLQYIHKTYPSLPVVIIGESMGGAIALHATSIDPNLIQGLISSVPAGDRFGQTDEDFKVGIHTLLSGFNSEMNVGRGVVAQATQKEDLRQAWANDPMVRMKLSPHELLQFQEFMDKNFACARQIKSTPVLFIQGMNDKLVRPAGTWKLLGSLATGDRQIVFSKTGEHLILEEGQFSDEDIRFIETWLKQHGLSGAANKEETAKQDDGKEKQTVAAVADAKKAEADQAANRAQAAVTASAERMNKAANDLASACQTPQSPGQSNTKVSSQTDSKQTRISYWIELYRNGKMYRCNNKYPFHSGDSIRFHIRSQDDGYAYIVMKEGSSGKQAVLFPQASTGMANDIAQGQDYPLPNKAWLTFDNHPGTEKISLIFSLQPLDQLLSPKQPKYVTAYVSADKSGSKDLVPARMQLSWQDPDPVIIPENLANDQAEANANDTGDRIARVTKEALDRSLVMLTSQDAVLSVDIALSHN